jgi:hypothetical protein
VASAATSAVASAPAPWLNALRPTGPVAQRPAVHRTRGSTPCGSMAAKWLPRGSTPCGSMASWLNTLRLNGYPVA